MSLEDELAAVVAEDEALHAAGLVHLPDEEAHVMDAIVAIQLAAAGMSDGWDFGRSLFLDLVMFVPDRHPGSVQMRLLFPVSCADRSTVALLHAAANRLDAMLTDTGMPT